MKKDITLFGLLVCFYILVVTLLYTNKPKELGIQNIACNLDRALLQMAGFEPEGDMQKLVLIGFLVIIFMKVVQVKNIDVQEI